VITTILITLQVYEIKQKGLSYVGNIHKISSNIAMEMLYFAFIKVQSHGFVQVSVSMDTQTI